VTNKKNVAKTWIALRFPLLPLEVFAVNSRINEGADTAIIVTHKQQVVCANPNAVNQGIKQHMSVTTAQILVQSQLLERDLQIEKAAIHQLANTLYSFTPYIEKQTPNPNTHSGLLIEVSRSLTLFKGLGNIITLIQQELQAFNFHYCLGTAHTSKAAWLLSFDKQKKIPDNEKPCARTGVIEQLQKLDSTLLAQCPQHTISNTQLQAHIAALKKSGFNSLGDIVRQINTQSLASFRKRWGQAFSQLIADIFDIDQVTLQPSLFEKPTTLFQPEEFFHDSIQFDYPITNSAQLIPPMEYLLQNLSRYLCNRQRQCQSIDWVLMDIYHHKQQLEVHTSENQNQWPLLLELSRIQLDAQTLNFEVDTLELRCRNSMPLQASSHSLHFDGDTSARRDKLNHDFTVTTAKLKARLGEDALFKIACTDRHIPEQSQKKVTIANNTKPSPTPTPTAVRPSWLFEPPLPIQQRQQYLFWRGRLELLQGPERIEGDWWQSPTARDYFIARRDDHLRLWIFYDQLNKSWFVQGVLV